MALEKATITIPKTRDFFRVLFNPEEYTVSSSVNYAQAGVPGLNGPILQFVNGGLTTLQMELLVDTYEEHRDGDRVLNRAGDDVRDLTGRITSLMEVAAATHAPPVLLFTWGRVSFSCVLAQMQQRFVMFRADGTPVRARLSVTFNHYRTAETEAKEVKRETADYSSVQEVYQGETLATIAWRNYGDPVMWRPIALRNEIDDPRRLEPGALLVVPRLPYRYPETGEVFGG